MLYRYATQATQYRPTVAKKITFVLLTDFESSCHRIPQLRLGDWFVPDMGSNLGTSSNYGVWHPTPPPPP